MDRLTQLSERLDAHLTEFGAIGTQMEPWSCSGSLCDSDRKPSFPSLYITRSKDAGLMSLKGSGTATVQYRVKSRNVDENREDGVPLYGADIEITSLEPVKTPVAAKETGLESTLFLREFGSSGPQRLRRVEASVLKKLRKKGAQTDVINKTLRPIRVKQDADLDRKLPRGIAYQQSLESTLFLRQFAGERERDGAGRFAAGRIPSAGDYAIADQAAKKKKVAAGAGAAAALAGGALAGTARGRSAAGALGKSALRAVGRLI